MRIPSIIFTSPRARSFPAKENDCPIEKSFAYNIRTLRLTDSYVLKTRLECTAERRQIERKNIYRFRAAVTPNFALCVGIR